MGFEALAPYNDEVAFSPQGIHPYIHDFTVVMNGQKLAYMNAVAHPDQYAICQQGICVQGQETAEILQPVLVVYAGCPMETRYQRLHSPRMETNKRRRVKLHPKRYHYGR